MGQVYVMSNYIIKYSRGEAVKYISHLDFVRMFHRTVRRTDLQMEFSHGFNPHPVMTVALPLSVGVTSDGEYMKIGLTDQYSEQEIQQKLNDSLPEGFQVLAVKKIEGKEIDLTKINRAIYRVEVELDQMPPLDIVSFLENAELKVMKKSKSGIKEANIRPYIYQLELEKTEGNTITLSMCLAAGSSYNLKPDTVLDAMTNYIPDFQPVFYTVHRICMLADDLDFLESGMTNN